MIINPYIFGGSYDPDAQAFITAAGITDTTQKSAINQFVIGLKADSLWTKMKALYPFVGGTATTCKYNLANPLDTNAAFRLFFNGGWSISNTGVTPNGGNGWANTFIPLNTLSRDSNSSGIYIRTNLDSSVDYGVYTGVGAGSLQVGVRSTNLWYTRNGSTTVNTTANTDSRGFFQMTRSNSSNYKISKNTTKTTITQSATDTFTNSQTIPIGALNVDGSILAYSNREYALMYVANTSFTDTDLDNMNSRVVAFQTALSRNV